MSDYLFLMESRVSPDQWQVLMAVERAAADLEMNLYLVGGAIRDLVAGSPIDDLDFVVEGKALKLVKALCLRGARVLWESAALQSAEMEFAHGILGSVSMARTETFGKPGAAPKITPAPIIADLRRRDFPMNSIGVSLSPNSRGLLLDPANGLADIEKREIRPQHNYIFFDDPVRMFRAVRLRARLGFAWDAKTAAQFQRAREEGLAEAASGEPLTQELRQLARERNPVQVLKELEKEKLLRALSPRLQAKAIDWQGIAKTAKASQQLAAAGLRAPSFALFLHLVTRKLPTRDKNQLADRLRLPTTERNLPQKLEADAKRLAKDLVGKNAGTPAKLFQLLSKTPPDILLLLITNFSRKTIQSRLKTYFTKYLPLRSSLPEQELQQLGVSPKTPRYQKILDAYFFASIAGELRTPNQQQKFLARLAQQTK
ncbi:MAG: CCA tRNA nucleotidyltransferase [Acidobacteria bacterium]|nr:CCA tRNA nucleotidyltransferase [Acidobacteriota bacterium]